MIRLKVKELAEARGFNMSSLSRRSDISFSTIKRLWRDPYRPASTDMLEKIARTLNVAVTDLIEEVPDQAGPQQ